MLGVKTKRRRERLAPVADEHLGRPLIHEKHVADGPPGPRSVSCHRWGAGIGLRDRSVRDSRSLWAFLGLRLMLGAHAARLRHVQRARE